MSNLKKSKVVMLPTKVEAPSFARHHIVKCFKEWQPAGEDWIKPNTLTWCVNHSSGVLTNYEPQHLYFLTDEKIEDNEWCIYNHNSTLLLKRENIDRYGYIRYNNLGYDLQYCKKVVATTDTSLFKEVWSSNGEPLMAKSNYPQPSQQFIQKYIEEFNRGNIITEVMVEYEEEFFADSKGGFKTERERDDYIFNTGASHSCWTKTQLKINLKDNTITIKKVKAIWNREEVHNLMMQAWIHGQSKPDCHYTVREDWIENNLN